jgi:hypothetical protein
MNKRRDSVMKETCIVALMLVILSYASEYIIHTASEHGKSGEVAVPERNEFGHRLSTSNSCASARRWLNECEAVK